MSKEAKELKSTNFRTKIPDLALIYTNSYHPKPLIFEVKLNAPKIRMFFDSYSPKRLDPLKTNTSYVFDDDYDET